MANPPKFGMHTVIGGIQVTPPGPGPAAGMAASLSAADFERFAAKIKPIWELDDAPFAPTAGMNAVDLAALGAGGGVNAEVAATLNGSSGEVLPSALLVTDVSAPVGPRAAPVASNGVHHPPPAQAIAPLYRPP